MSALVSKSPWTGNTDYFLKTQTEVLQYSPATDCHLNLLKFKQTVFIVTPSFFFTTEKKSVPPHLWYFLTIILLIVTEVRLVGKTLVCIR